MKRRSTAKPLTDTSGEVRELTAADFRRARPASKVLKELLPPVFAESLLRPKTRGPNKKPRKAVTTIRLPADTLERWKASGPGWQTRMAELLSRRAP